MARDEMLDILGRQKRDANERRKVCKQVVDAAKRELDSYTPLIDSVQRDITGANSQREYHSTQAYHARREKDRFQAEYHTNQARSYASQAASHKRYKQDLIAKKQLARDRFNKALADLRFANSECNRLKDEFERRLAKVREQEERGRAARAEEQRRIRDIRNASNRPRGTLEAGNAFVNGHPAYYEKGNNGDSKRMDLFEGGVPRSHHKDIPHPHIVTEGDQLKYMREEDGTINADE